MIETNELIPGVIDIALVKREGPLFDNLMKMFGTNFISEHKSEDLNTQTQIFEKSKLFFTSAYNKKFPQRTIVTFDGIDATGKGTVSRTFTAFINQLEIKAGRINIPDYNTTSGKIITSCLSRKMDDQELSKTLYEFANHFAVNRGFVKEEILTKNNSRLIVFDRWINSSIAFSIAKILLGKGIPADRVYMDTIGDNPDLYQEIKDLVNYIHTLEYIIIGNFIPHYEFILYANINIINNRIRERRMTKGSTENKDNDVHDYDIHEDKKHFLDIAQETYKNLVSDRNLVPGTNQQFYIDTGKEDERLRGFAPEMISLYEVIERFLFN